MLIITIEFYGCGSVSLSPTSIGTDEVEPLTIYRLKDMLTSVANREPAPSGTLF